MSIDQITWAWIGLALLLIPIQLKIVAPYGRHGSMAWGPVLPNKLGWILMELVSLCALWYWAWDWITTSNKAVKILIALWTVHYVHRTFIYPLMTKTAKKKIPLLIVLFAMIFNSINGGLNGYYLGQESLIHNSIDILSPAFIIGGLLFCFGFLVNVNSDYYLISLRKRGSTQYKIPRGGLFKYVSCPNHLGEMIEWIGFALMAWNLAACAFAVWTVANLLPRSIAHHQWYLNNFDDYPKSRKAVLPLLL